MMKTPDEIKKGLECCSEDVKSTKCAGCPYSDGTCANDLYANEKDALALIQQLEAQVPRWISVKERLPKQGVNVPVIFSDGFVGMGQWLGWGWYGYVYRNTNNVTHWMPLPEPPKE